MPFFLVGKKYIDKLTDGTAKYIPEGHGIIMKNELLKVFSLLFILLNVERILEEPLAK